MSNLALANLTVAVAPRQQETATGPVAKKDSTSSKTSQVDDYKEVMTSVEAVDSAVSSSKANKKFSFNDLLQKRLTKENTDTSNDKSGTSRAQKQVFDNTELTSDKKIAGEKQKKQTPDNLLPVIPFVPQALQASKAQPVTPVVNPKSLQNSNIKVVQLPNPPAVGSPITLQIAPVKNTKTAQAAPVESSKVITNKEVTTEKAAKETSRNLSPTQQKETKDSAEIKDIPVTAKTENPVKNAISPQITNNSQQKHDNQQNLNADSNTAGENKPKPAHLQTEVTEAAEVIRTDKSSLIVPKTQTKAQASTTVENTEAAQTIISPRQPELVSQTAIRQPATETITANQVATQTAEKSAVQQAFLKPSEQIINQVQNTITGSTQQIQVTLTPAELGTIRITFRQQDGQIEGLMEVQNPEVRKDVEKALPQIAAALAQNGIQVRRMDIAPMQNQQSNQDSFQSPEHEFNLKDQHYLANNGDFGGTGNSGDRISGRDAQFADELQDPTQQTYDLSGLNMYA